MGIFGSKHVVPTTLACTVPQKAAATGVLGPHRIHLLAMDDSKGKECAEVRSTISSFAPLGFLESATTTKNELGVTRHTYTYAWPPPRDETIAGLLAGIWTHTTTKRVVTARDDTAGGFVYTAVGGRRVVPLKQMTSGANGWYPVPIETIEVETDVGDFQWEYVRKTLERTLTRERWDKWRSREAASYSAGAATGGASGVSMLTGAGMLTGASGAWRKQKIVATWENTVGAILLHYKRVMREAICTLSSKCHEESDGDEAPLLPLLPQTQTSAYGKKRAPKKTPAKKNAAPKIRATSSRQAKSKLKLKPAKKTKPQNAHKGG